MLLHHIICINCVFSYRGLEFIPVVQSLKIIRVQTFHAGLYRCRGVKATVPICVYFSDNATITVRGMYV